MSGFCFQEMKYLSEREMVDHYFWSNKAAIMNKNEKIYDRKKAGMLYPDCCKINFNTNQVLFLSRRAEISILSRPNLNDNKVETIIINCCGQKIDFWTKENGIRDDLSIDAYELHIKGNKKNWEQLNAK